MVRMTRQSIRTLADVLLTFFIYWVFGTGVHEMSHALTAQLLGWSATVVFKNPLEGYTAILNWAMIPLMERVAIAVAGGSITAILFVVLSYFVEDWECDLVLWFLAPLHGSYAIFEVAYVLGLLPAWILATVPVIPALMLLSGR